MDKERLYTMEYWEEKIVPHKWCFEGWQRSFDDFYAAVGARPRGAVLRTITDGPKLGPNNAQWQGGKVKKVKANKYSEDEIRRVLRLGHDQGLSYEAITQAVDGATLRDVQDMLAGRRYVLSDYDYKRRLSKLTAEQRVPAKVARDIRAMQAQGVHPDTMAAKWGLPIQRVYKILARG